MAQKTLLIISKLPEFRSVAQDLFDVPEWDILRPLSSKILPSGFPVLHPEISLILLGTRRENFEKSNIPHQYQRIWPNAKIIVFVFSDSYSTTALQYEEIQTVHYTYCNFINSHKLQTLLIRGIRHFHPLMIPTAETNNSRNSTVVPQEKKKCKRPAQYLRDTGKQTGYKTTKPPKS